MYQKLLMQQQEGCMNESPQQSGGGAEFSSSSSSPASSFPHGQLSVPIGQQHVCLLACCTFFLLASGYMCRK